MCSPEAVEVAIVRWRAVTATIDNAAALKHFRSGVIGLGGSNDMVGDLERLVAVEDIRLLKANRDRAVDEKDWPTYEHLHAPDFVSSGPGRNDWIGARANTQEAARICAPLITVHHSLSPAITVHSATAASAVWLMTDYLFWSEEGVQHSRQGFGYYDETYEKIGGEWRFKTRTLRYRHHVTGQDNSVKPT